MFKRFLFLLFQHASPSATSLVITMKESQRMNIKHLSQLLEREDTLVVLFFFVGDHVNTLITLVNDQTLR